MGFELGTSQFQFQCLNPLGRSPHLNSCHPLPEQEHRDHQQITFVTLNRFCPLSTPHLLFLTDNIMLDGIATRIKWKIHASFCSCSFSSLIFITNFLINRFTQTSHQTENQNLLSLQKFFVDAPVKTHFVWYLEKEKSIKVLNMEHFYEKSCKKVLVPDPFLILLSNPKHQNWRQRQNVSYHFCFVI